MRSSQIISIFACCLHLCSMGVWASSLVRKNVERWVWGFVGLGFLAMLFHRLLDAMSEGTPAAALTGFLIAAVALTAAVKTHRHLRAQALLDAKIQALHDAMAKLEVESKNRGHVAEKLAELLSQLRNEIEYYERMCVEKGLPKFVKDGGTDRTRTG